ncbi:hypothetical protein [Sphingobacterium bambusae]|uniref:DUF4185 domain-containing protein n=1 Tax=Sphingobacterium bambusae TaxID=662858 RepID=A0ABW6BK60_9SPHI|nr:hypothetical protein [Sphingobacterium bambusae]WPL50928.1 hypothetical protein SCB77_10755 [Sphingobacterium bambusae]
MIQKVGLIFCIVLLGAYCAEAQYSPFAIIADQDGFSNVRLGKNRTVVDRVHSNQVFALRGPVDDDGWQEWSWIDYPDYSLRRSGFEKFIHKTKEGMMHGSRIKLLVDLPQWARRHDPARGLLICSDPSSDREIEIVYGEFLVAAHLYTRNAAGAIEKIDKQEPWGIDGYVYSNMNEIKSITLRDGSESYRFPAQSIVNLLMPNTDLSTFGLAVGTDDHLFLYMSNGDGAGAYDVVWTIHQWKCSNQFLYRNF